MNAPFDPACAVAGTHASLVRPRQLVAARWLARHCLDESLCVIEVGCNGGDLYQQAHIPGALYLDTTELETAPHFNKVSDTALLAVLLRLGIGHDATVILYGRNTLAAARAAHLLLYAGVKDVGLLDGGFGQWCAEGHSVSSGAVAARPVAAFGAPFPGRPELLIDTAQVRQLLTRSDAALASIRTWSEHCGKTSGYDYISVCGDIPGARWGRAGQDGDVNSMSNYQDADGCMVAGEVIAAMWAANGIHAGQEVAFYCGTGWRASLAFFYAWLLGWPNISVYDGGWYEWSSDGDGDRDRVAACRSPG